MTLGKKRHLEGILQKFGWFLQNHLYGVTLTLEMCWQNPRVSKIIRIPQAYIHIATQLPQQDIVFNAVLYDLNNDGGKTKIHVIY